MMNLVAWNDLVPVITLPVLAEIDNKFIELRFSYNDQINLITFFIDNQNIVDHPGKQILTKEENNWLLKVPIIAEASNLSSINGVLSINDDEIFLINAEVNNKDAVIDQFLASNYFCIYRWLDIESYAMRISNNFFKNFKFCFFRE